MNAPSQRISRMIISPIDELSSIMGDNPLEGSFADFYSYWSY